MKKAIIIGATSGIGKELAQLLVEDNYLVGLAGRRVEILEKMKLEQKNFSPLELDISKPDTIIEKLNDLASELGGLDLLIISSGTGDINEDLDFEVEKRTIDTNVLGFTCVADWAFNFFQNSKKGHLVAITSIGGLRGSRSGPSYNASKAYQISYLEALRQKAVNMKIPVVITDIRPGFVNTEMAKGDGLFWVSSVEKAAKQIFRAIRKKRNIVYVTRRWRCIAWILKIIPGFIYNKM